MMKSSKTNLHLINNCPNKVDHYIDFLLLFFRRLQITIKQVDFKEISPLLTFID